jgi:hypothetical protein
VSTLTLRTDISTQEGLEVLTSICDSIWPSLIIMPIVYVAVTSYDTENIHNAVLCIAAKLSIPGDASTEMCNVVLHILKSSRSNRGVS